MSYSAQNKKAFFSLVRAGGSHDAWADSLNEFTQYFENNSSANEHWNKTYYLRPIDSRKIPAILESHLAILSASNDSGGRRSVVRMNTTTTEQSHMGTYKNFASWTSIFSDDSTYERSVDGFTIDAFYEQVTRGYFSLEKDRSSSILFFPREY
tara:strand:- start:86 stop:544 length:459 start_codon:yes stop_codon:yes gene_type:complete